MSRRSNKPLNIAEAKARLSELVRRASAGEEIVIARDHRPLVRLSALSPIGTRRPGSARGRVKMTSDFDTTPAEFADYLR